MDLSPKSRRTLLLLSNRFAGLASSRLLDGCVEALRRRGAHVAHHAPGTIAEARALVRDAARLGTVDAVVAAGGDGTIRQIASELIGSALPLAIVPGGTGNVLAHEIGLAREPEAVVGMIMDGPVLPVRVARANGEPFLLMAGAGLDARVLQTLDTRLKGRIGKAAYCPATLSALMHPVDRLRIHIATATETAAWVIVTNACHYGGSFVLTRSTTIAQQGLVAVIFKSASRAGLFSHLSNLALGRLDVRAARAGSVKIVPCTDVVIEASHDVPTQLDGDVFGSTPMRVQTSDDVVQLVVPQACPLR